MKGFYLTISNGLLTPEHRKKMGSSVWEFMWLLDHMTSISEDGIGKVLGGKPIKCEEIAEELGNVRKTIQENLTRLEQEGYIQIIRAPYGLIISVNKAQKTFNQETKNRSNEKVTSVEEKVTSLPEKVTSNKTRQLDKTEDTKDTDVAINIAGNEINNLILIFKGINPSYEKLYSNKTERLALEELVKKYGYQKVFNMLSKLPEIISKPYAPRITTPLSLQRKLGDLLLFMKQEEGKEVKNGKPAIDARRFTRPQIQT